MKTIKLYNRDSSPYCARVRIQIYHKTLPVMLTPPPGGSSSDEYRKHAVLGRVPALDLGDTVIAESLAIMEYLEDSYPERPMRPDQAEDLARMRMLCQANDHYLMPALRQVVVLSREQGTRDALEQAVEELRVQMGQLEALLGRSRCAVGNRLTLADCTLVPGLHFTTLVPEMLGFGSLLRAFPRLDTLLENLTGEPSVSSVRDEITAALESRSPS